jgi:SAM-dependent methyltransferase
LRRSPGASAQDKGSQDSRRLSSESVRGNNASFYEFFAHTYADLYSVLDAGETVRQWLVLLREVSPGFTPARRRHPKLLDVGCGPGWHLAHWAAAGYNSAGLDSSPRMLALARSALQAAGADSVPLYEVNLAHSKSLPQAGGPYDLLVSHTNFAQIFSPRQLKQVAARLASISKPGSLWMMDLTSPTIAPDRASDSFTDAAGIEWTATGTSHASGREYRLVWRSRRGTGMEQYWMHNIEQVDTLLGSSGWIRTAWRSWRPQDRDAPWRRPNIRSKRLVLLYEQRRPGDRAQQSVGNNAL